MIKNKNKLIKRITEINGSNILNLQKRTKSGNFHIVYLCKYRYCHFAKYLGNKVKARETFQI